MEIEVIILIVSTVISAISLHFCIKRILLWRGKASRDEMHISNEMDKVNQNCEKEIGDDADVTMVTKVSQSNNNDVSVTSPETESDSGVKKRQKDSLDESSDEKITSHRHSNIPTKSIPKLQTKEACDKTPSNSIGGAVFSSPSKLPKSRDACFGYNAASSKPSEKMNARISIVNQKDVSNITPSMYSERKDIATENINTSIAQLDNKEIAAEVKNTSTAIASPSKIETKTSPPDDVKHGMTQDGNLVVETSSGKKEAKELHGNKSNGGNIPRAAFPSFMRGNSAEEAIKGGSRLPVKIK